MARYYVNTKNEKNTIAKEIYGHFSEHLGHCIYEGVFVGEDSPIPNVRGIRKDVTEALRQIRVPVLRWPGGCFADEYHWQDGVGPAASRKRMINTHWGGVVEDNSFGTHEFLDLCEQIGCEPYVNGNVGSGTVREMSEWVEYMTFSGVSPMAAQREANGRKDPWQVKYIGVGNENWGCGGNMRAEYYADLYRQFQTYVRNYGENRVFRIACGANSDDYHWTEVLMREAGRFMQGLTLHYYTIPYGNWGSKGSALTFNEADYYATIASAYRMDELLRRHTAIMDAHDPAKRVALLVDEWGTWFNVEEGTNPGFLYQQNTLRDAVVAAHTFSIFHKYSDRVRMANIAQMVNVLQAVILTNGDKMLRTPTWHVFDLFKDHQDATLLESSLETTTFTSTDGKTAPNLTETASKGADGSLTITLCNASLTETASLDAIIDGTDYKTISAKILTGAMDAHNDFSEPDRVSSQTWNGVTATPQGFTANLPPVSVVAIRLSND